MLIERGVIKVGLEIEVAAWEERKYVDVAVELLDAEYMVGSIGNWVKTHKYHCKCDYGCKDVSSGKLIVPHPLVSATYDGTLPKTGAEFIISPILLAETPMREMLAEVWDIIVRDAVWTDKLPDYYENSLASPSIHLHVSANLNADYADPHLKSTSALTGDILHALTLFSPELFALADTAEYRRGVKFRLPTRELMELEANGTHHGLIHVRRVMPGQVIHLEWRLFEAAYHDWDYIEGAAYIAAVLTRSFLGDDSLSLLMASGYQYPYDSRAMLKAFKDDDVTSILEEVDVRRLEVLRRICLEQLDDDDYGLAKAMNMFDRVERKLQ